MYKHDREGVNNVLLKAVWDLWAFPESDFPWGWPHGDWIVFISAQTCAFLCESSLKRWQCLGGASSISPSAFWRGSVNILVWAEFARKTPHEVSLIQSAGIVLTTLLLMLKGNTQEKAKQRANMSEKSVKESVQTHSCLHLHACVLSHTLSLSLSHTHTHSNDSTSFDFKIKGQIHYRIIKSALEKKISILWD